jgi:hypothetical protein
VKFCDAHWDRLQHAISARGMDILVAEDGEQAASKLTSELEHGRTVDNFDPLIGAHNAIVGRAMETIRDHYRQNSLMLMADDPEHPEWACPICALYWCHDEHNRLCTQEGCDWPKDFDWGTEMIDGSADFMLSEWKNLS